MYDKSTVWFVTDADLATTPSQLYHENSKIGEARAALTRPSGADERRLEAFHKSVAGKHKSYDFAAKHALDGTLDARGVDLVRAMRERRTRRSFSGAPLAAAGLGRLLNLAAGPCGSSSFADGSLLPLRAYPSAGGLYPLEVYPVLLQVDGFPPGVYHHDVHAQQLSFLRELPDASWLHDTFLGEDMLAGAGAVFVITAVLPRARFKYGERAYRYVHLEAGHLAQNLVLAAQEGSLAAAPVGGFIERRLEKLLDIDGVEEFAVYSVFIGSRREDPAT
jgi:SagB-type dehydrogenase family enzyme